MKAKAQPTRRPHLKQQLQRSNGAGPSCPRNQGTKLSPDCSLGGAGRALDGRMRGPGQAGGLGQRGGGAAWQRPLGCV